MDRDLQGASGNIVLNQQKVNELPMMNEFCSIHAGLRVEYVTVDPSQEFVFKCVNCVSEENVPQSTLIPINLILTSDDKTIFANFPITDRSLAIELRTLAQAPTNGEQVLTKISSFFKEFRTKLLHKLEILEKRMIEKAKSISNFGSITEEYNKICAKKKLKEIVNDSHKQLQDKSAEIKIICSEVLSKEAENNSSIRRGIERLKTFQSAIDFETPIKITEQIISQVDKIDIFLVEDVQLFQQLVESNSSDKDRNISNLLKLVNNKLNGISVESYERFSEQLNRIKFAFSTIEVPEIGKVGTYLESLKEDSSSVVQKLVEDLAKNQEEKERDDNEREDKQKLVATDLVKLVSNKTNFCSNEYIEDVGRVVNTLNRVLGLFLVRKPRVKAEQQSAFNNLTENQLLNLVELAIKTNQITLQHADSYLNSLSPSSQTQPNSNLIRNLIGRAQSFNNLKIEGSTFSESLDKILVTYPIFELISPIQDKLKMIPIPIKFTKTNFGNSQEIQINENGRSIQISLDPSKDGQVVSDILNNELGYLLKLKFTRPFGDSNYEGFLIGLILNSKIHSNHVLEDSLESGLTISPDYGAQIILKGDKLTSEGLLKTTDCFEFRFCISKQLFLYADMSYSNINQAESKYFDPSEQYRFGICLDKQDTRFADMSVEISEFCTIDPEQVNNFE